MRFEEYVQREGAPLLAYAYVLTGDSHDAQDLVQTTLTKALAKWYRVRRSDNVNAYVRKMLANSYLDNQRRRSSGEVVAANDELAQFGPQHPGHEAKVLDSSEMRWLIQQLPPRARVMIVMRYLYDMPDSQVAAELGVAVGTVRSTLSRSLAHLRSDLSIHAEGTTS